jgi:NifU-like protein involved in Fe-S cluster formation|tara:strand:- start:2314 stop:2580 length:267 start_codon:yes stop_codon:yes gene_type:complete
MKIQIKVDKRGNVVDSCFKTFGCGSAIASSSVLTEWVKGRHVDEAINKNEEIARHLNLPPVKPLFHACLRCNQSRNKRIENETRNLED